MMYQFITALDDFWNHVRVHREVGDAELLFSRLPGTQQIAGATQLQVFLCYVETVLTVPHHFEAGFAGRR